MTKLTRQELTQIKTQLETYKSVHGRYPIPNTRNPDNKGWAEGVDSSTLPSFYRLIWFGRYHDVLHTSTEELADRLQLVDSQPVHEKPILGKLGELKNILSKLSHKELRLLETYLLGSSSSL